MTRNDLIGFVMVFGGAWLLMMGMFALAQLAALR